MAQMQNEDKLIEELKKWADEEEKLDPELEKQIGEMDEFFRKALDAYLNDPEDDIRTLLVEDNYLMEELCDKLALINLLGATKEELLPEDYEAAYLSFLDTCFESAKIIDPLSGFGLDRLKAGLDILKVFEEEYWPLITRVTGENVEAFRDMIPEEHLDDLLIGRKSAIGMLLHKGKKQYAVGVLVYSKQEIAGNLQLGAEWIYVEEEYRKRGIANVLMASLAGLSLAVEDTDIVMECGIPRAKDESEAEALAERFSVFMNFMDSWKFDCRYQTARDFYVSLEELKGNPDIDVEAEGVVSLAELGREAKDKVREFIRRRNSEYSQSVIETELDFYDPEVSCATVVNGHIEALFLLHRYESGDYRLEYLHELKGLNPSKVIGLIRFAYRAALQKGDMGGMVFGRFEREDAHDLAWKFIPFAQTRLRIAGRLNGSAAVQAISSRDWGRMRIEAGFSNDILTGRGKDAGNLKESEMEMLAAFLQR